MDINTIYAQSSDIKSRTYLEYRKDMKKKAIAELEIMPFILLKLSELHPDKMVKVEKSGGDKFLWFLRKGGVTRKPDFVASVDGEKIEIEFQYAGREDLNYYDFKISKVVKTTGQKKEAHQNTLFFYIHKIYVKYAVFSPQWVVNHGDIGTVEAWRSNAYRVPKEVFETLLISDEVLFKYIRSIDAKNNILEFQHNLLKLYKDELSSLLQGVIDENKLVRIIPKDLDSFFKVCFILDNIDRVPNNGNLWLVYLLSFINENLNLDELAKIVYCLDFLYPKYDLKANEISLLCQKLVNILELIKTKSQPNGSYISSPNFSPSFETRCALFSINLLEDINQDLSYYYQMTAFTPVKKIFENVSDCLKTSEFISALS
jgi:hypothetical protein